MVVLVYPLIKTRTWQGLRSRHPGVRTEYLDQNVPGLMQQRTRSLFTYFTYTYVPRHVITLRVEGITYLCLERVSDTTGIWILDPLDVLE